jgi:hypothetical protein
MELKLISILFSSCHSSSSLVCSYVVVCALVRFPVVDWYVAFQFIRNCIDVSDDGCIRPKHAAYVIAGKLTVPEGHKICCL